MGGGQWDFVGATAKGCFSVTETRFFLVAYRDGKQSVANHVWPILEDR